MKPFGDVTCGVILTYFASTNAGSGVNRRMDKRAEPRMDIKLIQKLRNFACFVIAFLAIAGPYGVRSNELNSIIVKSPWSRASILKSRPGVVYVTIVNQGMTADRLLSVSSLIASKITIHESVTNNGVMAMRPRDTLRIDGGQSVELKPGGLHLMLFDLNKKLRMGDVVELSLGFERGGTIFVRVPVLHAGSSGP